MVLPSARWVQIVVDLGRSNRDIFRHSVIRYLARQWNASHDPERQIEHIQLAYIVERPDPDGHLNVDKLVIAKFDPFAKGAYRALQREDHWIHYYANGKKEAEGDYRKGLEQGTWTLWYEDGRKQGQGTYVAGQLHGKWTFWYDEGEKVEAFFDRGRLVPRPLARSNPVRQGGT